MVTPDNNQVRKYTAFTILILGLLLLATVVGLLLILPLREARENLNLEATSESDNVLGQMTLFPLDNNDVEPTPSPPLAVQPGVETTSTQIIAPLLSFREMIEPWQTDRYLFQAAADVPLNVRLETTYDLRLKMQIVDEANNLLYDEEFSRGQHDITFRVRQTGEYRILITGLSGRGEYIISMAFATKPGKEL
jgi:hypothetical protein